jgi:hypothetical protein
MPSTVTAYSIKIACPGDAAMELIVARDVIARWNSAHAISEKRILLPLGEDAAGEAEHDLLLEFFRGADLPEDAEVAAAEEEIETQLRHGRPALVYFSGARTDFLGADPLLGSAVEEFKRRHMTATVEAYADEKEFRAKFARQLNDVVGNHEHFQAAPDRSDAPATPEPKALDPRRTGPLSPWAQRILVEACDDFEAYIGRSTHGGQLRIQANGKQLVEAQDADTIAQWNEAFGQLQSGGFIRDAGCNGQLFQISAKGFDFLKGLGKTPVGYIAEMGGM